MSRHLTGLITLAGLYMLRVDAATSPPSSAADFDQLPSKLPFYAPLLPAPRSKPHCTSDNPYLEYLSACAGSQLQGGIQGTGGYRGTQDDSYFHSNNGSVVALIQRYAHFRDGTIAVAGGLCQIRDSNQSEVVISATGDLQQQERTTHQAPMPIGVALDPLASSPQLQSTQQNAGLDRFLSLLLATEVLRAAWSVGAASVTAGGIADAPSAVRDVRWGPEVRIMFNEEDVDSWLRAISAPSPRLSSSSVRVPFACSQASDAGALRSALQLLSPGAEITVHSPCLSLAHNAQHACSPPACVNASLAHLAPARLPLLAAVAAPADKRTRCAQPSNAWQQLSRHVRRSMGLVHSMPKPIAEWPAGTPGFPVHDQLSLLFHVPGLDDKVEEDVVTRVEALLEMANYRKTASHIAVVDLDRLPQAKTAQAVAATDVLIAWGDVQPSLLLMLPEWGGVFHMHDSKPEHDGFLRIVSGLLRRVLAVFAPALRQPGMPGETGTLRTAKMQSGFGDVIQLVQQRRRDMAQHIVG